jgi:hypothetical protein
MKTFYSISPTNHGWGYGYGFFSNYRICLEQLIHYENMNSSTTPYIDWTKTTWAEGFNPFESSNFNFTYNPFDLWFDQEIPSESDRIEKCTLGPRPDLIHHAKDYFDEKESLEIQQTVDRKYIKIKKDILDKVDEIYQNELEGHVVLGVMARGTEYNFHHPMYGVFNAHDYIREIEKILNESPDITKIFIVSEDTQYVNEIKNYFPSSFFVPDVFRRTDETDEYINIVHCWPNVSVKRENQCKLLGEETIIQTKLLSKCDYLFGRHSGIFCGAILWNENIKKIFKI